MQDAPKAAWSIPYVSVVFSPSLKQNFIAYRSSKVSSRPDCIFEIHQLWQSGFSRVYSNCCCSCSFEREIIKIGQSSHKMYSNKILNFQASTTILNAWTKKSENLLNAPRIIKHNQNAHTHTHIYIYIYIYTNLISTSIHGTKKTKKTLPGTSDKSISNHRPGSKRKKRPTSSDPLKKSRDTQSVVKRKPKNPPRILQCYNY